MERFGQLISERWQNSLQMWGEFWWVWLLLMAAYVLGWLIAFVVCKYRLK